MQDIEKEGRPSVPVFLLFSPMIQVKDFGTDRSKTVELDAVVKALEQTHMSGDFICTNALSFDAE